MPVPFESLKQECEAKLASLQTQDVPALMREMRGLCRFAEAGPSIQDLGAYMQRVQGAKDRVVEIVQTAHYNHLITKKVADVLTEAFMAVAEANSADKRKGQATLELGSYQLRAAEAEAFYKHCMSEMENLDSKHLTASRRITCIQMSLKLSDYGDQTVPGMAEPRSADGKFDAPPSAGQAPAASKGSGTYQQW